MACIILLNADDADCAYILKDDFDDNVTFDTAEEADSWLWKNARVGWCSRIVDLDD